MALAVAVGTTSAVLLPANTARAGYLVQNPSTGVGTVWLNIDGIAATAAPPCVELKAGDSFSWTGGGAINAIASAATTVTVLER